MTAQHDANTQHDPQRDTLGTRNRPPQSEPGQFDRCATEEWLNTAVEATEPEPLPPALIRGINDPSILDLIRTGRRNAADANAGSAAALLGCLRNVILLHDLNYRHGVRGDRWIACAHAVTGLGKNTNLTLMKLYPSLIEGKIKRWIDAEKERCDAQHLVYRYPGWQDCAARFVPRIKREFNSANSPAERGGRSLAAADGVLTGTTAVIDGERLIRAERRVAELEAENAKLRADLARRHPARRSSKSSGESGMSQAMLAALHVVRDRPQEWKGKATVHGRVKALLLERGCIQMRGDLPSLTPLGLTELAKHGS